MNAKLFVHLWVLSFIFQNRLAYASGDPAILYWLGSIAAIHLGLFAFLYAKERKLVRRIVNLIVYSISGLLLWNLAMNFKGPNFNAMYAILLLVPLAIVIFLLEIKRKEQSSKQSGRDQ